MTLSILNLKHPDCINPAFSTHFLNSDNFYLEINVPRSK